MVDSPPEVSVVIPCFNGESFVGDAIESLLAQTRGPVEIIVVDDCSTDTSVSVVEPYVANGSVVLLRHETNRGIAATRNSGLRLARGSFIGFLDQDDLWDSTKLEMQMAVFEGDKDGSIGVVFCEFDLEKVGPAVSSLERSRSLKNLDGLAPDALITRLLLGESIPIISTLIRRSCFETVGEFDESIRSGSDDLDLLVRIARQYRFAYAAGTKAVRRLHESNFTDVIKMTPDTLNIIVKATAGKPSLAAVAARAKNYHWFKLARARHVTGDFAKAREAYRAAVRERKTDVRSIFGLLLSYMGGFGNAVYRAVRPRRPR
jgi:glycosyltransferase involved in cell wall biosynthesis